MDTKLQFVIGDSKLGYCGHFEDGLREMGANIPRQGNERAHRNARSLRLDSKEIASSKAFVLEILR